MSSYISFNRHKYHLKIHLIFVCKYRKKLLSNSRIDESLKKIFRNIESKSDFNIDVMETDKNHIHLLVSYPPRLSVSMIVRRLKQESTVKLWTIFPTYLLKHFWKEKTFWSDGYFVSSIGEANPETIRRYIENQG